MTKKELVVSLMDLTSLNDNDTNESISTLVHNSRNPLGDVAAICIYKEFIPFAKGLDNIKNTNIQVATVINFPTGNGGVEQTLEELNIALNNGADEIDLVMPYKLLEQGEHGKVGNFIGTIRKACGDKALKVIIESGELHTEELIRLASKVAISEGVDFIKTSTGKVPVNATVEAARFMLDEIKSSGTQCGFKVAGGVKSLDDAVEYLDLATSIMGDGFISNKTFRFGTSSLLHNILGKDGGGKY